VRPEWEDAIRRARLAPVTLVIGESDTGKTTLVTALASVLQGLVGAVGVVDADLGQSEIGPPTTIGLGRVDRPLPRLSEADLLALHFVGRTSPAGDVPGTLAGIRRMLDRARQLRVPRVIVDTSGLVRGDLGRTLKQAKIELVDPDLVICLERAAECEDIVQPYLTRARPAVLRVPAAPGVRARSAETRRQHRRERLRAYFAPARRIRLDLRQVTLRPEPPWSPTGPLDPHASDAFTLVLAGLDGEGGETLGLGCVCGIDFAEGILTLDTAVEPRAVRAVTLGRERYEG
jgi:polynucleotide 5'-hydroxyl-kinase GRC3/NOL9